MKIAVLCGGNSTERAISIVSGTEVCRALIDCGHNAVLLDVFTDAGAKSFEDDFDLDAAISEIKSFDEEIAHLTESRRGFFGEGVLSLCLEADVVFMALHGNNGEDGRIQAVFDLMDIKYTGSGALGSAVSMDKALTKQVLRAGDVPTAPWIRALKGEDIKHITKVAEREIGFPAVVKVNRGGSSVGVYITNSPSECMAHLEEAFELEDVVIVERFVKGREFSVGIIDKVALPVIEIAPIEGFYDYKNKYTPGCTVETCPAEINEEVTKKMQKYAEEAFELLGLSGYARIDFIMDEMENIYCLESNTLPGMTPTSLLPQEAAAVGLSFGELCEKLIEVSLKELGAKK